MATKITLRDVDLDSVMDPNTSPLESVDTSTTPDTEISPPDSPFHPHGLLSDKRFTARKKLAQLTQEEKARPKSSRHTSSSRN